MKYLVLGSAGQIGQSLCNYLKKKHEVIQFDIENHVNQDLRIRNNELLESYVNHCDFVFFLAFDVGGSKYLKENQHTYNYIDNNIKLLAFTFETLKLYDKPFLFTSSQMSNMIFSSYGVAKRVGELYTKSLKGINVKLWNVYGNEYNSSKAHVITDFIQKAKSGNIDMLTNGYEKRQFLYSDDCSEALYILSEKYNSLPREEELHISSFSWTKIIDVAKIVQEFIPCTITPGTKEDDVQKCLMYEPNPFILEFWKPQTSLQTGIKNVINFYEDNNMCS